MSALADAEVTAPALTVTDDETELFSTANSLLKVLTTRLLDRPHGQISLVQLPDVFLIKANLEQLIEIEARRVKTQETLIQMAIDREEEGGKGVKKRNKNSGTQATAIRQAVAEEVESKTADLQRYTASLEDRLKKAEKLLESSSNENKCLADKYTFLASDLNKFAKAPKAAGQQIIHSLLEPLEDRIKTSEEEIRKADIMTGRVVKCIQEEHKRVDWLCTNDKINDKRHEALQDKVEELAKEQMLNGKRHDALQAKVEELAEEQTLNEGRFALAINRRKTHFERLDDKVKLQNQLNKTDALLAKVVCTMNRNSFLVDRINRGLFNRVRSLQSRLRLDMMPAWDDVADSTERESLLLNMATMKLG